MRFAHTLLGRRALSLKEKICFSSLFQAGRMEINSTSKDGIHGSSRSVGILPLSKGGEGLGVVVNDIPVDLLKVFEIDFDRGQNLIQ